MTKKRKVRVYKKGGKPAGINLSNRDQRRLEKGKLVDLQKYPTKYNQPHDTDVYNVSEINTNDGTDGFDQSFTNQGVFVNRFPDGTSNTQYSGVKDGQDYYYNTDNDYATYGDQRIDPNINLNEAIASLAGYQQKRGGNMFQEGGPQEQMMQQPGQEQMMQGEPQMDEAQMQQQQMQEQLMMQVAQLIQQGTKPEKIIKTLVKELELEEEQAIQIVQQTVELIKQQAQQAQQIDPSMQQQQMMQEGGNPFMPNEEEKTYFEQKNDKFVGLVNKTSDIANIKNDLEQLGLSPKQIKKGFNTGGTPGIGPGIHYTDFRADDYGFKGNPFTSMYEDQMNQKQNKLYDNIDEFKGRFKNIFAPKQGVNTQGEKGSYDMSGYKDYISDVGQGEGTLSYKDWYDLNQQNNPYMQDGGPSNYLIPAIYNAMHPATGVNLGYSQDTPENTYWGTEGGQEYSFAPTSDKVIKFKGKTVTWDNPEEYPGKVKKIDYNRKVPVKFQGGGGNPSQVAINYGLRNLNKNWFNRKNFMGPNTGNYKLTLQGIKEGAPFALGSINIADDIIDNITLTEGFEGIGLNNLLMDAAARQRSSGVAVHPEEFQEFVSDLSGLYKGKINPKAKRHLNRFSYTTENPGAWSEQVRLHNLQKEGLKDLEKTVKILKDKGINLSEGDNYILDNIIAEADKFSYSNTSEIFDKINKIENEEVKRTLTEKLKFWNAPIWGKAGEKMFMNSKGEPRRRFLRYGPEFGVGAGLLGLGAYSIFSGEDEEDLEKQRRIKELEQQIFPDSPYNINDFDMYDRDIFQIDTLPSGKIVTHPRRDFSNYNTKQDGGSIDSTEMYKPWGTTPDFKPMSNEDKMIFNRSQEDKEPRIGENKSEWMLRVYGNPGFERDESVWDGKAWILPQKRKGGLLPKAQYGLGNYLPRIVEGFTPKIVKSHQFNIGDKLGKFMVLKKI